MTKAEKLIRDIETLRKSIRLDWQDKASGIANPSEIRQHISWCVKELQHLEEQLSQKEDEE
jgi:hypothetical protein